MPIDRDVAIGTSWPDQDFRWSTTEVDRYHRVVGRTADAVTVLPTFAMTAPGAFGVASPEFCGSESPEIDFPGIRLNLAGLLHREQELVVHRPLPRSGSARSSGEVLAVEDRGTSAVLVQRCVLVDTEGDPLVSGISRIHARGEGGFGGPSDSRVVEPHPGGAPSMVSDVPVPLRQAQLYRPFVHGSSERDNVHTDPVFARAAGLPGPILQGACTLGMVCAVLVDTVLAGDAGRVRRFSARFLGSVFPGDLLRIGTWVVGDGYVLVVSVPSRSAEPVLSGALTAG